MANGHADYGRVRTDNFTRATRKTEPYGVKVSIALDRRLYGLFGEVTVPRSDRFDRIIFKNTGTIDVGVPIRIHEFFLEIPSSRNS